MSNPNNGCQKGIVALVDIRNIIIVGVAGGKKENQVASGPLGSRITMNQINIGDINNIHTGNNRDWASFNCETEAPTAMKMEAKNNTPDT